MAGELLLLNSEAGVVAAGVVVMGAPALSWLSTTLVKSFSPLVYTTAVVAVADSAAASMTMVYPAARALAATAALISVRMFSRIRWP